MELLQRNELHHIIVQQLEYNIEHHQLESDYGGQ